MTIKGKIGEQVYIRGKIREIGIDEKGTSYTIEIPSGEILMFAEKEIITKEEIEAPKKKAGRPKKTIKTDLEDPKEQNPPRVKKATVEDAMATLQKIKQNT
jgi:hypothetical protein